jgi:hypothetical protein
MALSKLARRLGQEKSDVPSKVADGFKSRQTKRNNESVNRHGTGTLLATGDIDAAQLDGGRDAPLALCPQRMRTHRERPVGVLPD